jgi:hypothetical protein
MKKLLLAFLATGCVSTSQIGPYVKHVQRNGPWLAVTKCMIVLEGDDLNEAECTVEHVPLTSVPMQPGPMQPGPIQPGPMQPAPMPPTASR